MSLLKKVNKERNYLRDYTTLINNNLKNIVFKSDKLRSSCNYYRILLKIIENKLNKIKINKNQLTSLNCSNSNIDRFNYSLLFNQNKFNQLVQQCTSRVYRESIQFKFDLNFFLNTYICYKQFQFTFYNNLQYCICSNLETISTNKNYSVIISI